MSLSRLELVGFKSFMSPVALQFKPGITAILGPNGCGKTNVVDAVRWVLGEQSARQLRSNKMENVIFNGTKVLKPMGYAAVNLTIDNERGVLPIDYSEITITRKVYRSGISEYFINKTPCRLKDIKELFADTGTGSHSYSVIEQEMIDYVLNDAHGERRQMFEEAAGIVKYRMRRDDARRKLKLTEADVIRLEDILEELGAQVRSLRYQVGKAKRFRTIEERIRQWGLVILRKDLAQLLGERRGIESELADIAKTSRSEDVSVSDTEKLVEGERLLLIDHEKKQTELQNNRYTLRRQVQAAKEKAIQFSERQQEAERRAARARREIEEAEARIEKIGERIRSATIGQEAVQAAISREREELEALTREYREITDACEHRKVRLLEVKQTRLDFLQDQVRVRSSQEHYESILTELDGRASETREKILELERATKELFTEMQQRESELQELQRAIEEREYEREELTQQVQDSERDLVEYEDRLSERRTELARQRSRRELYQRMMEELEGFPAGARHVLTKGDKRVRGPLAELVKVDDRYRPALESVLAGILDGIVVDTRQSALTLIEEVKAGDRGKVRLFAEDTGRIGNDQRTVSGSEGLLSAHVRTNAAQRALAEQLLGNIYVFESTPDALNFVSSGDRPDAAAVSLEGVYFDPKGGIYFSGTAGEEFSLLGRADELERIDERLGVLDREVGELTASSQHRRSELEQLRGGIRERWSEILGRRKALEARREKLQEVERNHIMKKEKCSLLMKALDEMENSRVEILSKLEEARLALEMRREEGDAAESARLEGELSELGIRRGELETVLTDKKVSITSLEGELDKRNEELKGLYEMERQFREVIELRTSEAAAADEESAALAKDAGKERVSVTELLRLEDGLSGEIEELSGVIEEKRASISHMERELKEKQAERERIISREHEVRISLSSIDTRMKDLVERGRELFKEDLSYYLEGTEVPLTDEEAAVTEEMFAKEKRKLEGLGAVNLAAIEEYEEKKTRFEFLEQQKEDLQQAKEELEEAIRKINRRARKRFLETYRAVQKHFAETFQVLFEGGEASLSLSEGSDPLEADIIITATPKGKRLQDISLLSGGERALTALALLFALYKTKPSPFCIFDEVDAPLDDANIQRFIRMLNTFRGDTQFIIITHNKRTMEVAGTLYGITMEQRGVSSVVSVDMEGIEEMLGEPAREELVESPLSSN